MSNHQDRTIALKENKNELRLELMESSLKNATSVAEEEDRLERNMQKIRDQYEKELEDLRSRCDANLDQLVADLELRRKVDIHEIEERKNQHINDLMKNHEKAFGQMKSYYNDITRDNLKLIKTLKVRVMLFSWLHLYICVESSGGNETEILC